MKTDFTVKLLCTLKHMKICDAKDTSNYICCVFKCWVAFLQSMELHMSRVSWALRQLLFLHLETIFVALFLGDSGWLSPRRMLLWDSTLMSLGESLPQLSNYQVTHISIFEKETLGEMLYWWIPRCTELYSVQRGSYFFAVDKISQCDVAHHECNVNMSWTIHFWHTSQLQYIQ